MCKGVEWGFQYHNFYGDWELSPTDQLCNGRPHYVHNTMYGGHAHLFHTIDPHYHVPRWVIGPAPGNENGWAFCESDAPTPDTVQATWISWDGFEWHSCKSFRYTCKESEIDGYTDSEEDFNEDEDEYKDDAEASLAAMLDDHDDHAPSTKAVTMTLEEYESLQTERQNNLEAEQQAAPVQAMLSVPEEDISASELSTPAVSAKEKKGKKDKSGESSDRGGKKEKKKGGMFKKK